MGTRQQKLAKQVQKDMGNILDAAARQFFPSVLISVMEVKMTPDLGLAKVYVSVFNAKNDKEVIEWLNENKGQIRHNLAQQIKNQVKKVPDLNFYADKGHDNAGRIDDILSNLNYTSDSSDEE